MPNVQTYKEFKYSKSLMTKHKMLLDRDFIHEDEDC